LPDSLHPFVNSQRKFMSPALQTSRLVPGNESIPSDDIPQALRGGFGNSHSGRNTKFFRSKTIAAKPQAGARRSKIASVIARARDSERFRQAPRAARQFRQVSWGMHDQPSRAGPFVHACQRLQRAEQNRARLSLPFARHVQTVVIAVDEIYVGKPRRSKQNEVASRAAGGGVCGRVSLPKISFNFHDTRGEIAIGGPPDKYLPQEFSSYPPRVTPKERPFERTNRANWRFLGQALKGVGSNYCFVDSSFWACPPAFPTSLGRRFFQIRQHLHGVPFRFHLSENALNLAVRSNDKRAPGYAHHFLSVHVLFLQHTECLGYVLVGIGKQAERKVILLLKFPLSLRCVGRHSKNHRPRL